MCDFIGRLAVAFIVLAFLMVMPATGQDGDAPCLAEPTERCILDLAVHEAAQIEDPTVRGQLLGSFIDHLVGEGDIAGAVTVAGLIQDLEYRAYLLHPAFRFGLPRTDDDRENRLIGRAVSQIWVQIDALRLQAELLIDEAVRLAESGALERAMKRAADIELPNERIGGLIAIARIEAPTGGEGTAARAFQAAWHVAGQLPDPIGRYEALTDIAMAQIEAGDTAGALRFAWSIDFLPTRIEALRAIAFVQSAVGDVDGGMATLHLAWEAALGHDGDPYRLANLSTQLQEISTAFAADGDPSAAEVTGALSLAMADTMPGLLRQVELVERLASDGEVTGALAGAYGIEDRYLRSLALIAIVEAMPKT